MEQRNEDFNMILQLYRDRSKVQNTFCTLISPSPYSDLNDEAKHNSFALANSMFILLCSPLRLIYGQLLVEDYCTEQRKELEKLQEHIIKELTKLKPRTVKRLAFRGILFTSNSAAHVLFSVSK